MFRSSKTSIVTILFVMTSVSVGAEAVFAQQPPRERAFRIGETQYRLAAPSGYCFLEGDAAAERRRGIEADGSVVVHVIIIDCEWVDRLSEMVGGFVSYGYWMTPRRAMLQNVGADRGLWIGQLTQAAGDPQILRRTQASQAEFARQLQQATAGLRFGEGKNLGIIDEDEYGLYMAQVQTLTYLGNNMTIAGVNAITLVNEKVLYYYLFDVYEEPETIIRLHDMVKAHLRRFIVENE